jgi:hypothetical protein
MESRKLGYDHFKINKISTFFRKRPHSFQNFIQTIFGYFSLQEEKVDMCGHLNGASTSSYPFRHLHLQQNIQRAQTCTVVRSSWSEEQGCLATIFCSFSFFFMNCDLRGGFSHEVFSLSSFISVYLLYLGT